ncbi:MAG: ATP-grasp domain-containing protein [Syntrophomonas sp.]
MKIIKKQTKPCAIILGGYVNGLGLVRSLGQAGIPSIVIDSEKNIASYSKYVCDRFICPNPAEETQAFIEFMIELGKQLPYKGVIFCTDDIWLIPVSKNQMKLQSYYLYPMSSWKVIERCEDKAQLYDLANEAEIPHPKTITLNNIEELERYEEDIPFPCVLKPSITVGFMETLGSSGRTLYIETVEELVYWKNRIKNVGLSYTPLILQELIPGGAENLYTLTAYSNIDGDILAYSTGHKIRQNPPDAGTIVSGRVTPEPELFLLGQKLIKTAGYYGISNTEFKKDQRDGKFKLIEINPRPGKWNYSVMASGINLPYMAYEEVNGKKLPSVGSNEQELVWISSILDLYLSIYGYKKKGFSEYSINLWQWLATIRGGKRVSAIFMLNDLLPGLMDLYSLAQTAFRRGLFDRR